MAVSTNYCPRCEAFTRQGCLAHTTDVTVLTALFAALESLDDESNPIGR